MQLTGIHHLTAVSARIRDNYRFYTQVMGMRLVKRSVNQDDASAYHLFYADKVGSPGSDLTFFDFPVLPEVRGTRSITRTALRVNGLDALQFWDSQLTDHGVRHGAIEERDGRLVIDFEDPEGQRLTLIDDGGVGEAHPWEKSPVPAAYQVRGLGPITLSVPSLGPTDGILQKLGLRPVRSYPHPERPAHTVEVYEMGPGGAAAELHIARQPDLSPARGGAGGVHHVALRTPDADYDAWADRLNTLGIRNSGKVDRHWFRSLYFREPNGILFELASDGPGFAVDEPAETLGEKLVLAPFMEPHREEIEANLVPLG
ncbi:MAG: ring-cleaving dioxygenase [Gemmatimonadaceae bacterium]|nr:ring-cleaving dioxygenase [Gemmatimonadaceae bacterium]MBX9854383.1 ring-cleaving dioxygenase [Gemmatimonadaceae bacterium]